MNKTKELKGRIIEVRKNCYYIGYEGRKLKAKLKGSFPREDLENLPVVGDRVMFLDNESGDSVILSVCERTGLLQRPDQAKSGAMQYMAANVDYVFIITSLNDDYSYNRIARYTSLALQGGAIPVAVLTKADLCEDAEEFAEEARTISDKLRVHVISARYGTGLDALKAYFEPGKTICLLGSSGAGKSTLINAITGRETMKTSAIREDDSKGRHTTTHRQMIELDIGVSLIDTPGMREIGVARAKEGIDETFSDIAELESRCKFRNCRHDREPGCAVKAAIKSGELSVERFMLYKSLDEENVRNRILKKKEISKLQKGYKKAMREF